MKWFHPSKPKPKTPKTCDEPEWKSEYATLVGAYANRSLALGDLGPFNEALDDAMRAVELEPTDVNVLARAYANRSLALGDLGRLDEALDDAMRAIGLEPTHLIILAQAYVVRALARAALGRDAEAEADLAEAFEMGLMEA